MHACYENFTTVSVLFLLNSSQPSIKKKQPKQAWKFTFISINVCNVVIIVFKNEWSKKGGMWNVLCVSLILINETNNIGT